MLFTRDGLEMASHETVAKLHSSLIPSSRTVDLTCGIGADLTAFCRKGVSFGFDVNTEHVAYANHNLRVHGLRGRALILDSTTFDAKESDSLYFDPQRREGGRRTLNPYDFSPNVQEMVKRSTRSRTLLMKLSPMLQDDFLQSFGGKVWFVSHQRQCCESLIYLSCEEIYNADGAIMAESGEFIPSQPLESWVENPLAFVSEADPAAIRGHCLGNFSMAGLGSSNGYLTSNNLLESPWLRNYKVLWNGNWRADKVFGAMGDNNCRISAVKCRGVDVDVVKIAKDFKGTSGTPTVLILYPVAKVIKAIIALAL